MKLALTTLILIAVAAAAVAQTPESSLPAGSGKDVFEAKCSTCHGPGRVLIYRRTRAQWASTVSAMEEKGLMVSAAESEQIVAYLTAAFPAEPEPPAPAPAPAP
jgi:mono/diheme cytochrome c family protein